MTPSLLMFSGSLRGGKGIGGQDKDFGALHTAQRGAAEDGPGALVGGQEDQKRDGSVFPQQACESEHDGVHATISCAGENVKMPALPKNILEKKAEAGNKPTTNESNAMITELKELGMALNSGMHPAVLPDAVCAADGARGACRARGAACDCRQGHAHVLQRSCERLSPARGCGVLLEEGGAHRESASASERASERM
eukprot:2607675-Rhodomonas_salina.1